MSENKYKIINIILVILLTGITAFIVFGLMDKSSNLTPKELNDTKKIELDENIEEEKNIEETKISKPLEDTLYMNLSVHVEGWDDSDNTIKYTKHASTIDEFAAIFEEYDMSLTLEMRPDEFVTGSINNDDTDFILELEERGHDLQIHADLGPKFSTLDAFIDTLEEYKAITESIGITVHAVSGVCASLDWVTAIKEAGFEFTTSIVEYCMKSLAELPEGYEYIDDCKGPSLCHDRAMASNFDISMHPWRPLSGDQWLTPGGDKDMPVIFIGGNLSEIKCISGKEAGDCIFDSSDIDIIKERIDEALENLDPERINTLNMIISIGSAPDEDILREFLDMIQEYIDQGDVEWLTMTEQYERFLDWEE